MKKALPYRAGYEDKKGDTEPRNMVTSRRSGDSAERQQENGVICPEL